MPQMNGTGEFKIGSKFSLIT